MYSEAGEELYLKRDYLELSHSDDANTGITMGIFICIKIKYKNKGILTINKVRKGEKV